MPVVRHTGTQQQPYCIRSMEAKGQKWARAKPGVSGPECQTGSCSLLALPVEVLHQVLDLLDPHDLLKLLRTSKTMAVAVMQHSAGKVTFKVDLCKGARLAAIRQLQWAPASTLKLMLDGLHAIPATRQDWDSMQSLQEVLPAPSSHEDQHSLQLPCFSEVRIQGFKLPKLVPTSLTALCPNMHTLHIHYCETESGERASSSSKAGNGSAHGHDTSNSTGAPGPTAATHLHTLVLHWVGAACLRWSQPAAQYVEQLRDSLPQLACLKMNCSPDATQMISVFESQLTELHLQAHPRVSDMQWWREEAHLQQLQKLVLPDIKAYQHDVELLLGLPNLLHVELSFLANPFEKDYSSYPCKWQTLHLHLNGMWQLVDTLAKLPLHSLVQPLKLGCHCGNDVLLHLPPATEDDDYHGKLELIAQRLGKCGVQVLEPGVSWSHGQFCDADLTQGSTHAHAITTIGPVFGLHARIALLKMIMDRGILEALGTVYGASLQQLMFEECAFEDDMLPAWRAALSSLPSLKRLELMGCYYDINDFWGDGTPKVAQLLRQLAEAMAQQPDGRCIEVAPSTGGFGYCSSQQLAELVLDGAEALLTGVEVTPHNEVHGMGSEEDYDDKDDKPCIRIISGGRS